MCASTRTGSQRRKGGHHTARDVGLPCHPRKARKVYFWKREGSGGNFLEGAAGSQFTRDVRQRGWSFKFEPGIGENGGQVKIGVRGRDVPGGHGG
jgi:hypothetical protein